MNWNPAPISVRPQVESLKQEVPFQLLNYLQDFQFLSYHLHHPKTNKVLLVENFSSNIASTHSCFITKAHTHKSHTLMGFHSSG